MQLLEKISWCFTPVPEQKPTKEANYRALGILIAAVALRAFGFLNNSFTLLISGMSSAFLLSNVFPIPLLKKGPILASYLAVAYSALRIIEAQITYAATPPTVSQPKNQSTYLDQQPMIVMAWSVLKKPPKLEKFQINASPVKFNLITRQ